MAYKLSDAIMQLENLGVLKYLASRPSSANQVCEDLSLHQQSVSTLLDLLVVANIVDFEDEIYSLPSTSKSALPMLRLETRIREWHYANQSIRKVLETGQGSNPLDQFKDQQYLEHYQLSLSAFARALALNIVRNTDVSNAIHIVDLGGADGSLVFHLQKILANANFTVVDRMEVESSFEQLFYKHNARPQFKFVANDILSMKGLDAEIGSSDTVIISNVLHLFTFKDVDSILRTLFRLMPKKSKLIIYDQFVSNKLINAEKLMVVDWANIGSRFDYNEAKICQLLNNVGFDDIWHKRSKTLSGALIGASR